MTARLLMPVLLAAAVLAASPPARAGAPMPPSQVAPAVPLAASAASPQWKPVYDQGRAMMISGIVISGAGLLVAAGSGFFILLTTVMGDPSSVLPGAGYAALVGAGLMVIGIPLMIAGIVRKRHGSHMKAGLALDVAWQADALGGPPIPTLALRF